MSLLFMGYSPDRSFEEALLRISPSLVDHFVDNRIFLSKIFYNQEIYLGKVLPDLCKLEELIDIQKHIISLLFRLVPEYPISSEEIKIFSYGNNSC